MTAHFHPFTDPRQAERTPPMTIVAGDGCHVTDSDGNTYLDSVSGLWCASLGFNPPRLRAAAERQFETLGYYHSFMGRTPAVTEELAERLASRLPGSLDHVVFGTSGSEAVETAVKLARYYHEARGLPQKRRVLARGAAYHGSLQMSAALTAMDYCHDGFDVPSGDVVRVPVAGYPSHAEPGETEEAYVARLIDDLDQTIRGEGADTIAAFIGEPVVGSGGVYPPPAGYWAGVQEVLDAHDVLLIADEIITGFGRTGSWFGVETYDVAPHLMTMAKQLTGAMFPMSAVALRADVRNVIADRAHALGTFGHGLTYGGHPVGAAIALETLSIYEELNLPDHVEALGRRLFAGLGGLVAHDDVVEVRGVGLMAGVELRSDEHDGQSLAQTIARRVQDDGVLVRVIDSTLAVAPPYVCTPAEIDRVVESMATALG